MAVAERTRALATHVYVTDETTLLYVLEFAKNGSVMVEDARTYDIYRMSPTKLSDWRVIRTASADA